MNVLPSRLGQHLSDTCILYFMSVASRIRISLICEVYTRFAGYDICVSWFLWPMRQTAAISHIHTKFKCAVRWPSSSKPRRRHIIHVNSITIQQYLRVLCGIKSLHITCTATAKQHNAHTWSLC